MSEPAPPAVTGTVKAPARPEVRAAIVRAASATGVDFSYLLGQARLESSLDPGARAATSSAAGLYQFTNATWLETMSRHGAEHGYGWVRSALERGDPAGRSQALALRYDPQSAALMAAELALDNRQALSGELGREPDAAELYMAHFLGADGAGRFLTALAADPSQSAPALLPKAAAANHAVFFERSGQSRTLGGVMELMRGRMADAMGDEGGGFAPALPASPGLEALPAVPEVTRPSMAATLAATFGSAAEAMPAQVRHAYGKLKAFGL